LLFVFGFVKIFHSMNLLSLKAAAESAVLLSKTKTKTYKINLKVNSLSMILPISLSSDLLK
jgi:hypothetical protein